MLLLPGDAAAQGQNWYLRPTRIDSLPERVVPDTAAGAPLDYDPGTCQPLFIDPRNGTRFVLQRDFMTGNGPIGDYALEPTGPLWRERADARTNGLRDRPTTRRRAEVAKKKRAPALAGARLHFPGMLSQSATCSQVCESCSTIALTSVGLELDLDAAAAHAAERLEPGMSGGERDVDLPRQVGVHDDRCRSRWRR